MRHPLRSLLVTLATTLILAAPVAAQDVLERADPLLNRMAEIDTLLQNSRTTSDQKRVALQDLMRVRDELDTLYSQTRNPEYRARLTRWRNSASQINNDNGGPLQRIVSPAERRADPNDQDRQVNFTPSALPSYDGPDSLEHVALRNLIDNLQAELSIHSVDVPSGIIKKDLHIWDGTYNSLLREAIYRQEQLIFNRGGTFTDGERDSLQQAFETFEVIKGHLADADATDEVARDLRRRMGDVERAYVVQQHGLAQGGNANNTWKTEWLQSAYLKMVYAALGAELVDVDREYSASVRQALELAGPAEEDLLAVYHSRMQRGRDDIARDMPDGQEFQVLPARGNVMRKEIDEWLMSEFFEQMNHPLYSDEKSAEQFKGQIDGILLGMQNGEMSDSAAVAALRDTRDEMTRQKPYRNKRDDLIKEINRTNKEIDNILYKKSKN
ncbi:hypothetical protein [Cognatishimia activa]|uniref:hypothetical protein n=1 Tax=Cognatishimia activa TaxID=1715691 RepID=UPI00223190F8|nr:hypothetical protein [Cognatishimia activa]UZD89622.1 hypothetical protein M0D42_08405 [Cognatishimia activa]